MSQLLIFIQQNVMLSTSFLLLIILYISFEYYQKKISNYSVSPQDAIGIINRKKGTFVDIRNSLCYKKSHIINSINITIEDITSNFKLDTKCKKYPLVIYGDNSTKSKLFYKKIINFTSNEVYILNGGINQWLKEGFPVQKLKTMKVNSDGKRVSKRQ